MSTIIKAQSPAAERPNVGAVAFNFDDVAGKANAYLQQVKAEAAEILAKANKEAESIRKQAQEQGNRTAVEQAEKSVHTRVETQIRQQMQTALPAVTQMVQAIEAERLQWLAKWEQNAVKLSIAIAEKVIRRQLATQPKIAVDLVREALMLAAGSQTLKIHLHPQDHAALGKQVQELSRQLSSLATVELVANDGVTQGGCVVQTEFGLIDQQVESQLARINEELF